MYIPAIDRDLIADRDIVRDQTLAVGMGSIFDIPLNKQLVNQSFKRQLHGSLTAHREAFIEYAKIK